VGLQLCPCRAARFPPSKVVLSLACTTLSHELSSISLLHTVAFARRHGSALLSHSAVQQQRLKLKAAPPLQNGSDAARPTHQTRSHLALTIPDKKRRPRAALFVCGFAGHPGPAAASATAAGPATTAATAGPAAIAPVATTGPAATPLVAPACPKGRRRRFGRGIAGGGRVGRRGLRARVRRPAVHRSLGHCRHCKRGRDHHRSGKSDESHRAVPSDSAHWNNAFTIRRVRLPTFTVARDRECRHVADADGRLGSVRQAEMDMQAPLPSTI